MKIALIFNKERKDTVGIYFERALNELGYEFDHFWTKDASTIESKYDLYLRIDHGDYTYDIPRRLHPSAFYVIDANLLNSYRKIKEQIKHFDFVFCVQRSVAMEFKSKGVDSFWMPLACDPYLHRKLNLAKRYDIAFVGNSGGVPRKFILQELRERFPISFIGQAPFPEMSKIYSQAKIGFNWLISQTKFTDPLNMRFYEIMSCGTTLLTNQITGDSLNMLGFEDRKHLVVYRSPRELFRLIDYYLTHEQEREEIAENGYRLTIEKHTYAQRLSEMLKKIGLI